MTHIEGRGERGEERRQTSVAHHKQDTFKTSSHGVVSMFFPPEILVSNTKTDDLGVVLSEHQNESAQDHYCNYKVTCTSGPHLLIFDPRDPWKNRPKSAGSLGFGALRHCNLEPFSMDESKGAEGAEGAGIFQRKHIREALCREAL